MRSRLEPRDPSATPAEQLVTEETTLRNQVLEELCAQLPAVAQAFMFDLMTGSVLARAAGGGARRCAVGLLADKVPALTLYLRDLVPPRTTTRSSSSRSPPGRWRCWWRSCRRAGGDRAHGEKSQPTALLGANLARAVRATRRACSADPRPADG